MADALAKYRNALKRYRKENPKVPYATAQKRVSAEMKSGKVSGVKKKKRVGAAPAARKAAAGTTRRKTAVKRTVAKTRTLTPLAKANKLLRDIDKLEIKRREAKARELKDIIQVEINKLHDQLDALKGRKRKSA